MRSLVAALALAIAAPAAADNEWRPVNAETGQIRDLKGLEPLVEDFPDSSSVRLRLFSAQLRDGKTDAALASLEWLNTRGYVFGDAAQEQIPKLLGEADASSAKALLIATPKVIEASEVAATLPEEAGLVESVLVDPRNGFFVATSQSEGAVYALEGQGRHSTYSTQDHEAYSGVSYDPVAQEIWVSLGKIANPFGGGKASPGVMSLCLMGTCDNTLVLMTSRAQSLNDLHIASDGTLYVSDSLGGGVYQRKSGVKSLDPLIKPGTFRSPQGLATSEDGKRLYVSDYRYGIAVVDRTSGEVSRLASDVPTPLDGVDGLWLHRDELIAVQNGTSPMRISAFRLSEDGLRVVSARILEQAHPKWREPLGGHVSQGALYYVANGQWDRYEKGKLKEGLAPMATIIRRTLLD